MRRAHFIVGLFACWLVLFAAGPISADDAIFVPPDDGFDWIQLTSGEWLRGELIGLFNDELEFDSDILDDLTIDWEDVAQIHSPRRFGARFRGGNSLSGEVSIDQNDVVISADGEEIRHPREQLVALTISAMREIDRWSGDVSVGINIRKGNTDFVEYNTIAGIERRTPQSRSFIDYIGNFNETEGVQVSNNHRVNIAHDRFSGSRFFWRPVISQYFRDPFQNIDHQWTLETGVGFEIINTSRTEWDVYSAVGMNSVSRVSVEMGQESRIRSPSGSLGTDFETELTSWTDYIFSFQMTFLDEASGEYQHHLLTTLSTDLAGNFDFDVSFVWDRTQSPPPDAAGDFPEKDDFRLMIGISYEF